MYPIDDETRDYLQEHYEAMLTHMSDEAHREIDATVATELMGWLDVRRCDYGWIGYQNEAEKAQSITRNIPHYSTDMNYAFLVIHRMSLGVSSSCCSFTLWMTPMISSVLRGPTAAFLTGVHPPKMYKDEGASWGEAFHPATAICLAALDAIRKMQEHEEKP